MKRLFCIALFPFCIGCLESSPIDLSGVPDSVIGCQVQGIHYVCWNRDCYENSFSQEALEETSSLGAEWIGIVPQWHQDNLSSSVISEDVQKSQGIEETRSVIRAAKTKKLSVFLKPHLEVQDGSWRGQVNPTNLKSWQNSYKKFILTFADLAQQEGVEMFAVGTEMKSVSQQTSFWKELISETRARYKGLITYAANWDEYSSVAFWRDLDLIGIDFYFPIASSSVSTPGEMQNNLSSISEQIRSFSVQQNKPVVFTEIGYRSLDGSTVSPSDFSSSRNADPQEQADAYQAVLNVFSNASWLEGLFWWSLYPNQNEDPTGYSPWTKWAGDLLTSQWATNPCLSLKSKNNNIP